MQRSLLGIVYSRRHDYGPEASALFWSSHPPLFKVVVQAVKASVGEQVCCFGLCQRPGQVATTGICVGV
jgi:hypothetical protein